MHLQDELPQDSLWESMISTAPLAVELPLVHTALISDRVVAHTRAAADVLCQAAELVGATLAPCAKWHLFLLQPNRKRAKQASSWSDSKRPCPPHKSFQSCSPPERSRTGPSRPYRKLDHLPTANRGYLHPSCGNCVRRTLLLWNAVAKRRVFTVMGVGDRVGRGRNRGVLS